MAYTNLSPFESPILMSTHNIGFYEDLTKIIFELSSNTHLIYSAATIKVFMANVFKLLAEISSRAKCLIFNTHAN